MTSFFFRGIFELYTGVPQKGARIFISFLGVMTINLHLENSLNNARITKSRTKPRHRLEPRLKGWCSPVKVVGKVNPDEVIKELKKHGVDIHRKTLLRWEKAELVPAAKRRALGQGRGWETDYPDETIPEALTAYILKDVQRLTNAEIAEARKAYYEGTRAPFSDAWGKCAGVIKKVYSYDEDHFYANEARQGFLNAEITLSHFTKNKEE